MSGYTSSYRSNYPSGYMTLEIQAERRTADVATIYQALNFNKHELEILRMQQILGLHTDVSGGPPTGSVFKYIGDVVNHINNEFIHAMSGLFGNKIPFHDNPSNTNFQFVQWFGEWMGIWDSMSADGVPTVTEILKMILQNKYDVEILFDPVFLTFADADGSNPYLTYTFDADTDIYAGYTGRVPFKPIGGACNLNVRPYPVYSIQNVTSGQYYEGRVTIPSGAAVRFWTDGVLVPGSGEDYKVGIFGNTPYTSIYDPDPVPSIPSGMAPPDPTGEPAVPSGLLPGGGLPGVPGGAIPGASTDPADWVLVDAPSMFEIDTLIFRPPLQAITDQKGTLVIGDQSVRTYVPKPRTDPTNWAQVGSTTMYGVNLSVDSAMFVFELPAKRWVMFGVTLASGGGTDEATDDFHFYYHKLPFNDGVAYAVPAEQDVSLSNVSLNNQIKQVPVGYVYSDEPGIVYGIVADEGTPGDVFVVGGWAVDIGS